MKLEVLVVPVSDVDRAKEFYQSIGFRLDGDYPGAGRLPRRAADPARLAHLDPDRQRGHRRRARLAAGGAPRRRPTSSRRARSSPRKGVDISEVFHDAAGVFHQGGTRGRVPGPQPERNSYESFASFEDPDGNGWVLQEITQRAPGR